jgi:TetR/AcrR family transcriptional regulator
MPRDLAASRDAILTAAEAVFAEAGFAGASVQQIASRAGVSRGMPGYAFGSKARLYQAVLERALAGPQAMVAELLDRLADESPRAVVAEAVGAYVDFLAAHPTYVRLLQRAALDGTGDRVAGASGDALADALRLTASVDGEAGADPRQLLVSVLALCFFPFAHHATLLAPLGLDPHDPAFLAERKAHVVDLLVGRLPSSEG